MRKKMIIMGVFLALASCAPTQQLISETPQTKREAFVYDDKVVIVTKTTIERDHYDSLIEKRKQRIAVASKKN